MAGWGTACPVQGFTSRKKRAPPSGASVTVASAPTITGAREEAVQPTGSRPGFSCNVQPVAEASWAVSPDVTTNASPTMNENQMVELNSGQIMTSMRMSSGGGGKRGWSTYTRGASLADGAWSPLLLNLPDPVCQGSFIRHSSTLDGAARNRLLFGNPASSSRVNYTVRLSEDEGQTWSVSRQIDSRPAAYSDLTVLADGTVGLFYETGDASAYETLTFVRFDLDWLTQADLDSDGDGMSDYYEGINGLSQGVNDANEDKDGDGVSNLDEFRAGTMANDPQSVLKVKTAALTPDPLR